MKKLRLVFGAVPVSAILPLVLLACLPACSSDDSADECQSAACTNLGTKPANKSQTFCGVQGRSGGVSGDAEKWLWSADTGTCECEIQISQVYWQSCAFAAARTAASGSSNSSGSSGTSSGSAQEDQ